MRPLDGGRFGDVFRWPPTDELAMFICRSHEERSCWAGVSLNGSRGFVTDYLNTDNWERVEGETDDLAQGLIDFGHSSVTVVGR